MTTRREINKKHEHAVIDAAVKVHNKRVGANYSVENRPDPPDAILLNGNSRTWIEHTDAFYPEWAKALTSSVASDKDNEPMQKGLHVDMDNTFADVFFEVVMKKLKSKSYDTVIEKYGTGILVVGLETPWLDDETINAINEKWLANGSPGISNIFNCIYLGNRLNGENNAVLWKKV